MGAGTLAVHAAHVRRAVPRAAGHERPWAASAPGGDPRSAARRGSLHLYDTRLLPAAPSGGARSGAPVPEPPQRGDLPAESHTMSGAPTISTTPEAAGARFRRTLISVMTVQIVTLALLWWL